MADLTELPAFFSAGTSLQYRRSDSSYPASDGWALKLYLRGPKTLDIVATADGDVHVVTLGASDTDDLTPGGYRWVERVSKGTEVPEAGERRGDVVVGENLVSSVDGDLQSFAERALAAVEKKILCRIPLDTEELSAFSRAQRLTGLTDLFQLRVALTAEVARNRGIPTPGMILVTITGLGMNQ